MLRPDAPPGHRAHGYLRVLIARGVVLETAAELFDMTASIRDRVRAELSSYNSITAISWRM